MAASDECPVCSNVADGRIHGYLRCPDCGHQWKTSVPMVEIENEVLDANAVMRPDALTSAKLRAIEKLTRSRRTLLDFGAGSGKYVYFCRDRFGLAEGVEVTPSCIAFAKSALGVVLRPEIPTGERYDVITAWHAIEHVPSTALRSTAVRIHGLTDEAFIVSVPNTGSWASKWFGVLYPYYDPNSHFQQFSPESIRRLLVDAGWGRVVPFHIGIYSVFCYAQGLVNAATATHNLLYYRLKRGRLTDSLSRAGVVIHGGLFLAFLPIALLLAALERLAPGRGACLNMACYKQPVTLVRAT